jgi:hypothetical protein
MRNPMRARCTKRRYRDKKQAIDAARVRMRPGAVNPPWYLRAYACHLCAGWHLTSQKPWSERLVP